MRWNNRLHCYNLARDNDSLLLQHERFQIVAQYCIADRLKNKLDVLRVDRRREMVEERTHAHFAAIVEHLQFELLHVAEAPRAAGKLREVVADVGDADLLGEQVSLVEEEDDGDVRKRLVVDDRVEYVARLDETVRAAVLEEHLVVLARRCEEENRADVVEALVPALALRALAADVDEAERNAADEELVFGDALRRFSGVKHVLCCRHVTLK